MFAFAIVQIFAITGCKHKETGGGYAVSPDTTVPNVSAGSSADIIPPDSITGKGSTENTGVFIQNRNIKLSPYSIEKSLVTYKLWKEVYDWATGDAGGSGQPKEKYIFANVGQKGGSASPYNEADHTDDEPVTMVSWQDCIIWCNAYTEKTIGLDNCVYRSAGGNETVVRKAADATKTNFALSIHRMKQNMKLSGYRLPTEAEWEFAARLESGASSSSEAYGSVYLTKPDFASGASSSALADAQAAAWFAPEAAGKTHKVNTKNQNKQGLYDMNGNVYEWCFDNYHIDPDRDDSPYLEGSFIVNPFGPGGGAQPVFRGGSWIDNQNKCSVGDRPSDLSITIMTAKQNFGFRLVRTKR